MAYRVPPAPDATDWMEAPSGPMGCHCAAWEMEARARNNRVRSGRAGRTGREQGLMEPPEKNSSNASDYSGREAEFISRAERGRSRPWPRRGDAGRKSTTPVGLKATDADQP